MSGGETLSLRDAAYAMCKKVVAASQREEIRRTVEALNAGPADRSDPNAGNAGYIGRQQHAQFYGYLVVDEYRATSEQIVIPPLPDQQRRVLRRGHAAIVHLNETCLAIVREAAPACVAAIDPYSRFHALAAPVVPAETLLRDADLRDVAEAFANTLPVKTILETPQMFRERLAAEQCAEMVAKLVGDLERCGAMAAPADLLKVRRGLSSSAPEGVLARYWFAMGCVRGMLSVLDQMLFQATLQARIRVLDEETVFGLRGPSQHGVGVGYSADCQPHDGNLRVESGDVLLLVLESHGVSLKSLCFVTHMVIQFDRQLGMRIRLDMRELDDELNPYSRLLV